MSKTALVCWLGGRDLEAMDDGKTGPILSTLMARPHREVHILYNPTKAPFTVENFKSYKSWLQTQAEADIQLYEENLSSPIHYGDIYTSANKLLEHLTTTIPQDEMSVLVTEGTQQMHAVWLLLCKTQYSVPMLEYSIEQGVADVEVPFDIAADFIPHYLAESDATLRRLSSGDLATSPAFESIITQSPVMQAQIDRAMRCAPQEIPVLILGESGTGKELFARAIHQASSRTEHNGGSLVTINCGAIPRELVDSELFGHVKGAFTGADSNKDGHFKKADGGTIFLDEFGELPLETQVRLLRVLQDGTFSRVGETKEIKVDVRVIAATNRDLMADMAAGKFREDLFYRVAVGVINLPPLRERAGDIMLLTDKLMETVNEELSRKLPNYKSKKLTAKAKKIIKSHDWPGNVRELYACLTRASVWSNSESITEREMREALLIRPAKPGDILGLELDNTFDIHELIKELKRHYIEKALSETSGQKTNAAKKLGLKSYQVLNGWMNDLGIK